MKKFIKILVVFIFTVLLCGCSLFETKTKDYSLKGLHVTMGEDMEEKKNDSFTSYLEGKRYIFTSLKETFDSVAIVGLSESSPLVDYTKLVIENNGLKEKIIEKDNLTYFKYTSTIDEVKYFYMAFTFKSKDSFWLINFACLDSEKKTYEAKFIEWAKTIHFDK